MLHVHIYATMTDCLRMIKDTSAHVSFICTVYCLCYMGKFIRDTYTYIVHYKFNTVRIAKYQIHVSQVSHGKKVTNWNESAR